MEAADWHTLLAMTVSAFRQQVEQDGQATAYPTLLDTEDAVTTFTQRLGQQLLQTYVDVRLDQAKAQRRHCPGCEAAMEWHARSVWRHGTHFGEVRVQDVYAYCRACGQSARPLHGWLGTGPTRWSLGLEETLVDLASDVSCQQAVTKLAQFFPGVEVGRTSALRLLHQHGAAAREFIEGKLAAALAEAGREGRRAGVLELEVEYDGGMIPVGTLEPIPVPAGATPELTPVRGLPKQHKVCRWEEVKLGLVQVPHEVEGRLYTVRSTGELETVFPDLLALAQLKHWTEETQVRGIADGARYIRPRLEDVFHACPFRFILDRPHAKEHLHAAGEALAQHGGAPAREWATTALDLLEVGSAAAVVAELRAATGRSGSDVLRLEANYFERNQDAVAYAEYRAHGWSTASSEVESGHRSVVQVRLKLPGTWWHPDNVPNILALRMLKANRWWAEYWSHRRQLWRSHAETLRTDDARTRLAA